MYFVFVCDRQWPCEKRRKESGLWLPRGSGGSCFARERQPENTWSLGLAVSFLLLTHPKTAPQSSAPRSFLWAVVCLLFLTTNERQRDVRRMDSCWALASIRLVSLELFVGGKEKTKDDLSLKARPEGPWGPRSPFLFTFVFYFLVLLFAWGPQAKISRIPSGAERNRKHRNGIAPRGLKAHVFFCWALFLFLQDIDHDEEKWELQKKTDVERIRKLK